MSLKNLSIFRKQVSKNYETVSVAYHEAGHVICSLLKHMNVESASIYEERHSRKMGGETFFNTREDREVNQRLEQHFMIGEVYVNYAGLIAEKLLYKKISGSDKFPSFLKDGSSLDTEAAAKLIKKLNLAQPGKERYLYKQKIIKQITNLLDDHWKEIELIAHFLIQKKKINAKQIKSLLIRRSGNKLFWKQRFNTIGLILSLDKTSLDDEIIRIIVSV